MELDYKSDTANVMIIRPFYQTAFYDSFDSDHGLVKFRTLDSVVIHKGTQHWYFANLGEIVFWHNYYTHEHRTIQAPPAGGFRNNAYWSRIPARCKAIDPKKGLNIVKEAYEILMKRHGGKTPKYYSKDKLGYYFIIKPRIIEETIT